MTFRLIITALYHLHIATHQIWEDRVCLYEFLGVSISESLQQERPHARPSAPSNGVTEYKPFQAVTVVSLSVQNVKYLLIQTLSLRRQKATLVWYNHVHVSPDHQGKKWRLYHEILKAEPISNEWLASSPGSSIFSMYEEGLGTRLMNDHLSSIVKALCHDITAIFSKLVSRVT